jgi:hypothetical protein
VVSAARDAAARQNINVWMKNKSAVQSSATSLATRNIHADYWKRKQPGEAQRTIMSG